MQTPPSTEIWGKKIRLAVCNKPTWPTHCPREITCYSWEKDRLLTYEPTSNKVCFLRCEIAYDAGYILWLSNAFDWNISIHLIEFQNEHLISWNLDRIRNHRCKPLHRVRVNKRLHAPKLMHQVLRYLGVSCEINTSWTLHIGVSIPLGA
jgi:hypothetical protein